MAEERKKTLKIDGDIVEFEIEVAGNVAARGEGGSIPRPRPFLGYRQIRNGELLREGVLTAQVEYPRGVSGQFTDDELVALYRAKVAS